jgi:pimeloyl-ACP methyl ester carboxylesterase
MDKTTSADGTAIAYDAWGSGPLVVIVGGAFNDRGAWAELAQALAAQGFRAVSYDRRGRGDSGDARPYAVEREIEDLMAVIDAARERAEDPVFLHGISSGAALVLQALAAGVHVTAASGLEPPYRIEGAPPAPPNYIGTLQEMVDRDDREGLAAYFHTQVVGMPAETLEPVKQSPFWQAMLAMAPTLVADGLALGGDDQSLPVDLLGRIEAPVLTVTSTGTLMPWLSQTAERVAEALPNGRAVRLEGGFHEVPTATLAPALADFYRAAQTTVRTA